MILSYQQGNAALPVKTGNDFIHLMAARLSWHEAINTQTRGNTILSILEYDNILFKVYHAK